MNSNHYLHFWKFYVHLQLFLIYSALKFKKASAKLSGTDDTELSHLPGRRKEIKIFLQQPILHLNPLQFLQQRLRPDPQKQEG